MLNKFLLFLKPQIDRWIVKTFIISGLSLITTGLTGLSWYVQLFLNIIEIESTKRLGQSYSIGIIDWVTVMVGVILLIIGLVIYFINKKIEQNTSKKKKLLIAILHKSIDNFIKPDYEKIDDLEFEKYEIQEIIIDQTIIYKNGSLDYPDISLLYQNDIRSKIELLTSNNSDYEIAYFGLAHIPLIWELGSNIADKFPVNYYEYNRDVSKWEKLNKSTNELNDFLSIETKEYLNDSINSIVKMEISYTIENSQVFQVIEDYKCFTTIKLNLIGLDRIKYLNQIEYFSKSFRSEIDKILKDVDIENIHIFYSGPVSLALALSRKISKRTDPNFIIYNYTRTSMPNYKWAIKISNNKSEIIKY